MEKVIYLSNQRFERIKERVYAPVHIYRGQKEFLRIGPSIVVERELKQHRRLLSIGYPLAKITGSGRIKNLNYFSEESLGELHFGQIFARDCRRRGRVSSEHFKDFLNVVTKFAK